jgi:hypothetical protein
LNWWLLVPTAAFLPGSFPGQLAFSVINSFFATLDEWMGFLPFD